MKTQSDSHEVKANAGLFEELGEPSELQVRQAQAQAASKRSQGAPRVLEPNRRQVELRASELESCAHLIGQSVARQRGRREIQSFSISEMAVVDSPAWHISAICARTTWRCSAVPRRVNNSSDLRSFRGSLIACACRPRLMRRSLPQATH
jgi:hypothetical protein